MAPPTPQLDVSSQAAPQAALGDRPLWLAYAGLCLLCWTLYGVAGTDWQQGWWSLWDALYEATWNLGPPMLLGIGVLPWSRALLARRHGWLASALIHLLAAVVFAVLWHAIDFALAASFFGMAHATATLEQRLVWRSAWAVLVYVAMVLGFNGSLQARRARAAAVAAAQAEAGLVRAELAAITGKLNPHFFFNTLNSIQFLVRKEAGAAEQSLLRFARMMRYLLDSKRSTDDRVPLQDELDFVRDYLALESLRLGARLRVAWALDDSTLACEIPVLTLQPLVENCIVHGISPRIEGGCVRIAAEWLAPAPVPSPSGPQAHPPGRTLRLCVSDDGAGCEWPLRPTPGGRRGETTTQPGGGIGLGALRRRFEVDYGGQARLSVRSAPGAGFEVEILIPQPAMEAA